MKRRPHPNLALLGGTFCGIALAGVVFLGWGELRLAFLLLVYCLLVIGLRLDQIVHLLDRIERRLAATDLNESGADREPPP